jgi:hypothetical protein
MNPIEVILVIMNFVLIFVLASVFTTQIALRSDNIQKFVVAHHETMDLLAQCYIPQGPYRLQHGG